MHAEAARALQSWGLAVLGWLVLSVLVRGGVLVVEGLDQPSAGDSRPIGHETLRAVLGVALLSGLWFLFLSYGGLVAAVLLALVAVGVSTISVLPDEAMTETVRTARLDAWSEE